MLISIRHQLRFELGEGLQRSVAQILLWPQDGPTQEVKDWTIDIENRDRGQVFYDAFANRVLMVSQPRPAGEQVVTVTGTVETRDTNGVLGRMPGDPVPAFFRRLTEATRADPEHVEHFREQAEKPGGRIAFFHALMDWVGGADNDAEPGSQVQSQTQDGEGQSQDQGASSVVPAADAAGLAETFIGICRAFAIPARLVAGYVATDADNVAAYHAWAEAYDEGLGWIAFDPALLVCPTDRHVRVAIGLDASWTRPLRIVPALSEPAIVSVEVAAGQQ